MTQVLSVRKVAPAAGAELVRLEGPKLGPNDVRVRVRAASVCGTDKHIYNWDAWAQSRIKPPMTFGHECCGDVVEIGSVVRTVQVGDFVSIETHIPCLTCRLCRTGSQHICQNLKILGVDTDGCFAEQVVIPEVCAWKNPPDIDPAVAAIQEPFGNAVYCVDTARVAGKSVAILGDGPIACFATGIARASGAASVMVTGLSKSRLALATAMGATHVIDASSSSDVVEALRDLTGGEGPDVVIEMAGSAVTVRQGLAALRKGGTFIAFGIPSGEVSIDYNNAIVFKEATIRGINGRRMFETWYQTRALITSGLVDPRPVITHQFPLEQFARAFDLINDPASTAGKNRPEASMNETVRSDLRARLAEIESAGLTKRERLITTPQGPRVKVASRPDEVINFCANNYLGLSSHPKVLAAAHEGLDSRGYGMSSVRFICGTQDAHVELERELAGFLGQEAAILFSSCWDANGGLFEILLGPEDAVISDELNHASIIDGVRLCKAQRLRYRNADMGDLRRALEEASSARIKLIATDGVFSMDGTLAPLDEVCALADQHDALVMVDDSHATGFVGRTGRGTPEHFGVEDRIDIVNSTLGKALGGASGGFTAARAEIVDLLRQRARPYLFSNSLAPSIVAASRAVLALLASTTELRDRLEHNARKFRDGMSAAGFDIKPGIHPIVPVMLGDARLAVQMASDLLDEGIYVIGFAYPVVPKDQARIRVQLSAAHSDADIDRALAAFARVGARHGVL